jgi:hypothetical protein
MSDTMLKYPKAAIAQGAGDLVQVTNFNLDYTNNAKLKHTLRRKASGITLGVEEGTLKFDIEIDESGMERDYITFVKTGAVKQVRAKLPGGTTLVLKGAYSQFSLDQPMDDACKLSMTFICGVDKAT